jgi:hypothetical protein
MSLRRFSQFKRPEQPRRGIITLRDLDIIEAILRYRFSPSSELVRLVGGDEDVTQRRLRALWEWDYINRFAFPGIRTHSEFFYYLFSAHAASEMAKPCASYLVRPELVMQPLWATPDRCLHALGDIENAASPPAG